MAVSEITLYPLSQLQPVQLLNKNLGPIQAIMNLGYYSVSVIILRYWFLQIFKNSLLLFNNLLLGFFLLLSLLSTLWSDTPIYALKHNLVILQVSIFAAHIAQRYSWQKLVSILRWSTTVLSFLSAFYALTKPSFAINTVKIGWQGVLPHPNRLGILLSLNITLWLFHAMFYPKQRLLAIGIALFSLYVRQNTNSATSLIVIIILLVLVACLQILKKLPYRQAFVGVLVCMLVGTSITFILLENWNELLESLGKDPTLTGRTKVWPQMIERGLERPLFGHGTHSFWQESRGEDNPAHGIVSDNGWVPPHAHNGFLEIFLEFGLMGLIIFISSFLITISMSVRYMISSGAAESLLPLIILTWMIIPNITVSSLFEGKLVWFLYVLINVRISMGIKALLSKKNKD
ncbi:MAG: O-antigen ligase family protein [Hormoscilla sp.]